MILSAVKKKPISSQWENAKFRFVEGKLNLFQLNIIKSFLNSNFLIILVDVLLMNKKNDKANFI